MKKNYMKTIFLFLIAIPFFSKSQIIKDNTKREDPNKFIINKNILRILLSTATVTKFSFTANYEREIIRPFSIFVKAGPAYDRQYLKTDANGNQQYKWIFNALISGELRYYYNLKKRAKSDKTIKNFSAFYLSVEELLVSKPIYIINKTGNEELEGKHKQYINIGYQYEKNSTFYNIFFGTRFPGEIYNNIPIGINLLHAGVTIGKVF